MLFSYLTYIFESTEKDLVTLVAPCRQRDTQTHFRAEVHNVGSHSHRLIMIARNIQNERWHIERSLLSAIVYNDHSKQEAETIALRKNSTQCVNVLYTWHSCILAYWNQSNTRPWNEAKFCALQVNNAHEVFLQCILSPLMFNHYLACFLDSTYS